MNILEPHKVAEAVRDKLRANLSEFQFSDNDKNFAVTNFEIIASIPGTQNKYKLRPPWGGIYYTYDDDGDVVASGHAIKVPVTIGVLFCSTPGRSIDNEALREAMYYAKKSINIVIGEYEINIGTDTEPEIVFVDITAKPQPVKIIPDPNPEMALVTSWFQYFEIC